MCISAFVFDDASILGKRSRKLINKPKTDLLVRDDVEHTTRDGVVFDIDAC